MRILVRTNEVIMWAPSVGVMASHMCTTSYTFSCNELIAAALLTLNLLVPRCTLYLSRESYSGDPQRERVRLNAVRGPESEHGLTIRRF
eukprot:5284268-Pyramimonas_sp.AAC.1